MGIRNCFRGQSGWAWRWPFIFHLVSWLRMSGTILARRAQGQLCVLLHSSVQVTRIFVSSVPPWGYLMADGKIPVNTINIGYESNPFVANYVLVEILLWKKHNKQFLFYTLTPCFVKKVSVIRRSNVRTDGRTRPLLFVQSSCTSRRKSHR